jgi:hypothetical protein
MTLEQDLRRVFTDDRHAVAVRSDAVARIAAGVRRRRRRRAVLAAAVVVAVLLIGVPVALRRHTTEPINPQPAGPTIPWTDSPLDHQPALSRRSARPERPACPTSTSLMAPIWVEDGPVTGDYSARTVLIGNDTDRRCTRSGTPVLLATDAANGVRGPLPVEAGTPADGGSKQYPATVDPGEPARFDIVTLNNCLSSEPRTRYRDVTVVVGDREYSIPGIDLLYTACPYRISAWYVQPPLLNATLTATLQAPAQAHRGTWYEYTVTVVNPQPRPFPLSPCPAYTQRLGPAVGAGAYWKLNCAVGSVPARRAIRFAMRLWVARDAPLGPTTLHWMAVTSNGRVVIANLSSDGVPVAIVD